MPLTTADSALLSCSECPAPAQALPCLEPTLPSQGSGRVASTSMAMSLCRRPCTTAPPSPATTTSSGARAASRDSSNSHQRSCTPARTRRQHSMRTVAAPAPPPLLRALLGPSPAPAGPAATLPLSPAPPASSRLQRKSNDLSMRSARPRASRAASSPRRRAVRAARASQSRPCTMASRNCGICSRMSRATRPRPPPLPLPPRPLPPPPPPPPPHSRATAPTAPPWSAPPPLPPPPPYLSPRGAVSAPRDTSSRRRCRPLRQGNWSSSTSCRWRRRRSSAPRRYSSGSYFALGGGDGGGVREVGAQGARPLGSAAVDRGPSRILLSPVPSGRAGIRKASRQHSPASCPEPHSSAGLHTPAGGLQQQVVQGEPHLAVRLADLEVVIRWDGLPPAINKLLEL
jgi:hypothetical protein